MKRILLSAAIALLATVMAACDDGGKDDNTDTTGSLEVTEGQTEQTTYADETEGTGGVTFTATAPWTASVAETTSTRLSLSSGESTRAVSWLRLKVNGQVVTSGEAGTIVLQIEMDENTTSADRRATITISSGNNDIEINVSQRGKTIAEAISDGTFEPDERPVPASGKVWKIVAQSPGRTETVTLDYEVARKDIYAEGWVELVLPDGTGSAWRTANNTRFSSDGAIHAYTNIYYEAEAQQDTETGFYYLGANGFVANGTIEGQSASSPDWTDEMTFNYDADNCLTSVVSDGEVFRLGWREGDPVSAGYYSMTYGTEVNHALCNLDLNWLLCNRWMNGTLFIEEVCGSDDLFGKRSAHMVSKIVGNNNEVNFAYTVNSANFITKIVATEATGRQTTITVLYK